MDKSTLEMSFEPARQHHELCALMEVKQVSTRKDREAGEWFWRVRIRGLDGGEPGWIRTQNRKWGDSCSSPVTDIGAHSIRS